MDLMDLKPKSDDVELTLVHPVSGDALTNDDGTEMSIVVYAQHSKEYRSAIHDQQDRRIKAMQKKGNSGAYSAADLERDSIELLAKVTKDWDITYGGEKPKMTFGKAKEVYSDVFWLRNQIEEALADSLDFTKA